MLERESKKERVQKMGFLIKSRVQKTGMSIEIQCPKWGILKSGDVRKLEIKERDVSSL